MKVDYSVIIVITIIVIIVWKFLNHFFATKTLFPVDVDHKGRSYWDLYFQWLWASDKHKKDHPEDDPANFHKKEGGKRRNRRRYLTLL